MARYGNWGWGRNDSRDYGQLLARFRLGWQPVRPADKPVPRRPGQLPLFDGNRQTWPPVEEQSEKAFSS